MWTKRPKPDGKGLRCKIALAIPKNVLAYCDRPARLYMCEKSGFYLGLIACCKNHRAMHERQGITMTLQDRRKNRSKQTLHGAI